MSPGTGPTACGLSKLVAPVVMSCGRVKFDEMLVLAGVSVVVPDVLPSFRLVNIQHLLSASLAIS